MYRFARIFLAILLIGLSSIGKILRPSLFKGSNSSAAKSFAQDKTYFNYLVHDPYYWMDT